MPYFMCQDEGGDAAGDADADNESANDDASEDSGNNSDANGDERQEPDSTNGDYKSFLGETGGNGNALGLDLGADKYVDQIGKLQDDVDRYSPRDYADSLSKPNQRPDEIPYTGAPDLPLRRIDLIPGSWDTITIPFGVGTFELRFTQDNYGAGFHAGGSLGDDGKWGGTGRVGMFLNLDDVDKSKINADLGIKTPGGGRDIIRGEYNYADFKKDMTELMQKMYNDALNSLGYPGTAGSWPDADPYAKRGASPGTLP